MPRVVRRRGHAQAPRRAGDAVSRGMSFSPWRRDFMLMQATVLLFAAEFAVLNLFADLANALLDRRA